MFSCCMLCVVVLAPYCQKCPADMMLDGNSVPYVVNTNFARQVEFTERKSSHTAIEIGKV